VEKNGGNIEETNCEEPITDVKSLVFVTVQLNEHKKGSQGKN
jgi:hypothetical protein